MGTNDKISILIADDHELTRIGIRLSLSEVDEFEVVGEAADGVDTVKQARVLNPDLVLMDIRMPSLDGIEATRAIKSSLRDTRVLILTIYTKEADIRQVMKVGADGYCLKDITREKLIGAIRCVAGGDVWLDREIAELLLRGQAEKSSLTDLSEREAQVLNLVVDGLTNQAIAEQLGLSIETVKSHLSHVMEKLCVSDRTQAAVKAVQLGLSTDATHLPVARSSRKRGASRVEE